MFFWIMIIAIAFIDQVTKFIVVFLSKQDQLFFSIPRLFEFNLIYNKGAAFGILQNNRYLFIVAALILFVFFAFSYKKIVKENKFIFYSYTFIGGGALGNLIDRFRIGAVIDFLDFHVWPVFNLADCFISLGVFVVILCSLFSFKKV